MADRRRACKLRPQVTTPASRQLLAEKTRLQRALGEWFDVHGRDLPWRRTHDPYEVLVSEVMLQQTQVATVLKMGAYSRFLKAFPTVRKLARADDDALLKAWEGLGYYRRARMLRGTAQAVVERHRGVFPSDLEALLELPGIGRYTAGALRAFAFGLPAVLVDGNVARVLSRLSNDRRPVDDAEGVRRLWKLAADLADDGQPRRHHAALMELGQTFCRPGKPLCGQCPVSAFCRAERPQELPLKKQAARVTAVLEHALWQRDARGRIRLQQESGSRRTGLWKLPLRTPEEVSAMPELLRQSYAITRYRVTLVVHQAPRARANTRLREGEAWIEPARIARLAMAAPFRKALEALLGDS